MKQMRHQTNIGSRKWIVVMLLLICTTATAQNPLNRRISIEAHDISTRELLTKIEQLTGYSFAYNSTLIENSKRSSISADNKTIKTVLDDVLGDEIEYKLVNNHIILTSNQNQKFAAIEISGYVSDNSEDALESAIIYVVEANTAAITNSSGIFQMNIKPKSKTLCLSISHPNCVDTIIYINTESQSLEIKLPLTTSTISHATDTSRINPLPQILPKPTNTAFDNLKAVEMLIPKDALYVSQNLNVYNRKSFQVSFLPFIGTNLLTKGSRTNNLSFNILAGYSQSLNGAEFGGIANINKNSVEGVQLAGITNITGGSTNAAQFAGILNINTDNVSGVQFAGIGNTVIGSVNGVQMGGIFNLNYAKNGTLPDSIKSLSKQVQIAGIVNYTNTNTEALQIGGITNIGRAQFKGMQISSILNSVTGRVDGMQLSGLANINHANDTLKSGNAQQMAGIINVDRQNRTQVQISGMINVATHPAIVQISSYANLCKDTVKAVQVSALNRAKNIKGAQVGLVNYAETCDGVQIGLINITKKDGFMALELTSDETYRVNATFNSGGRHFYTQINTGVGSYVGLGLGVGATTNRERRFTTSLEATAMAVIDPDQTDTIAGIHCRLQLELSYRLGKRFSIITGPTLNVFSALTPKDQEVKEITPSFELNSNNRIASAIESQEPTSWFGWFFGFRF